MQRMDLIPNNELISIIIPVYNVETYLKKCLDSILNQTYAHFEAILIDDGSTDKSLEICQEYSKKDSRFIVFSQTNRGVSAVRNKGLSIARGDYITFVDSDDSIHADYLQILYNNIKTENADMSLCTWSRSDKSEPRGEKSIRIWNQEETFYKYFKYHEIDGNVYAKLYKKECMKNITFDEKLKIGEDQIFVIQILEQCKKVVFQKISLYTYLIRDTSAMNSALDSRYWDTVYRAEWLRKEADNKLINLKGLFRKEELNIYVIMMVRHIKEGTDDSQKIVDAIFPRIKKSKCIEFYRYSEFYEFVRYFIIKYLLGVATVLVKLKKRLIK